jgi:hypothetical protein
VREKLGGGVYVGVRTHTHFMDNLPVIRTVEEEKQLAYDIGERRWFVWWCASFACVSFEM